MGQPVTGVKGIAEVASLAAILALAGNANVNIKTLFYDHTDDLLKQGPEGTRTPVVVTGAPLVKNNLYGTSLSTSQDETTADAPIQFGDDDSFFGDNSDVTSIVHNASFEGVYSRNDPYWTVIRTAKDAVGKDRLLYFWFYPEGKVGLGECTHGVVDARGFSRDFPREDYLTFSFDMPFKTREYNTTLPTVYPV